MIDNRKALIERLEKRAKSEREIAANNKVVADLLAPQLLKFAARTGHNTYATRMALDHRHSAKKDAEFADDLEAAIAALQSTDRNAIEQLATLKLQERQKFRLTDYWESDVDFLASEDNFAAAALLLDTYLRVTAKPTD